MGIVFKAVHEPDGSGGRAQGPARRALGGRDVPAALRPRGTRSRAGLSHPHLVPVLDAGEADGHPYLAARYVAGVSLAELLDEGPLPASAVLRS